MSGYSVIRRHRRVDGKAGSLVCESGAVIARAVEIDISDDVTVGARAIVSEGAMLFTHDHFEQGERRLVFSPLVIGDRAFIGARAIVLESCSRIGEGAVIGAGAVVTCDVPDGETWAGNPARRVR